jgi:hypothetical protein
MPSRATASAALICAASRFRGTRPGQASGTSQRPRHCAARVRRSDRGLLPDLLLPQRAGERSRSSGKLPVEATETGDPVLIRRPAADYVDEVDVCELATDNGSGMPAAGWLVLQVSVGVRYNAESVISACPDDKDGIWGSDLQAELTLTGDNTDWPLVNRIWAVLVTLWPTIAWDEMSYRPGRENPQRRATA